MPHCIENRSGFSVLYLLFYLTVIYIIYIAIYNLYFHPLQSFPGPFFARLTDVYHTYLLSTRKAHLKQYELHKRYGLFREAEKCRSLSLPTLT